MQQNIEFERCIDFLVRMIDKYGDEVLRELEEEKQPANKKSRLNSRTLKILYRLKIWYQNKTTTPVLV